MKNVYILTREGREYSKEGCDHITGMIVDGYKDTSELIFSMGAAYNDTKHLGSCIDNDPDCYIAISTEKGIPLFRGPHITAIREKLKNAGGKTSWEVACDYMDEVIEANKQ